MAFRALASRRRRFVCTLSSVLVGSWAALASAQVTEPNGASVPGPSSQPSETSLQAYFDGAHESIDALSDASAEPGVFSPRCDFTATLVLSQSSAEAGLAWYNVPPNPTQAPDQLFRILPNASTVGQTIAASDIRTSANYAGGLIGFVLLKNIGQGPDSPVYYSEYQRNKNCTGCSMPGYWKMMLSYRSSVHQSSYYLAFEDWEGADQTSWQGNDGDFNDKVFLVTGVSCPGGGVACDTGKMGLCAAGLTECAIMGAPVCKPQYTPQKEQCDNVDNDCNGLVDEGALCPTDQVCVRGKCVGKCNTGEFNCPLPLVCGSDGYCIDAACKDVSCAPGLACRAGKCVGACVGVTCPLGQECRLDRCVDPCQRVTCGDGSICSDGVCVGDCSCNGCPAGKSCARDGRCVEAGCETVSCGAGQGCRQGRCVDSCEGAACPGGATCANGECGEPVVSTSSGGSAGAATAAGGFTIDIGSGGNALSRGGAASAQGGASSSAGSGVSGSLGGERDGGKSSGCGCRLAKQSESRGIALLGAALALGALKRRRKRP